MQQHNEERSVRLAVALTNVLARMPGVSDGEAGGALLRAATRWALQHMPPPAVAELLRDIADALEQEQAPPRELDG